MPGKSYSVFDDYSIAELEDMRLSVDALQYDIDKAIKQREE